jgi:hypothetical protein
MALFKALSAAVYGIDAHLIDVEVDYSGQVLEKASGRRRAREPRPGEGGHPQLRL